MTLSINQVTIKLTRLRDTFLPRLISGELSVADAESQAEEVV